MCVDLCQNFGGPTPWNTFAVSYGTALLPRSQKSRLLPRGGRTMPQSLPPCRRRLWAHMAKHSSQSPPILQLGKERPKEANRLPQTHPGRQCGWVSWVAGAVHTLSHAGQLVHILELTCFVTPRPQAQRAGASSSLWTGGEPTRGPRVCWAAGGCYDLVSDRGEH